MVSTFLTVSEYSQNLFLKKVQSNENGLIDIIANWYSNEWAIPIEKTFHRLENTPNNDVLFQLILLKGNIPIATGGLYKKVGLVKAYPKFKTFKPWIALLYVVKGHRNSGYGGKLLKKIEYISKEMGLSRLYLHTYSAEKFYLRNNWIPLEKVGYKDQMTVIMKKEI